MTWAKVSFKLPRCCGSQILQWMVAFPCKDRKIPISGLTKSAVESALVWMSLKCETHLDRCCGHVVSVLTLYLNDPSSNTTEVCSFYVKMVVEKDENKQKEAGLDPILSTLKTYNSNGVAGKEHWQPTFYAPNGNIYFLSVCTNSLVDWLGRIYRSIHPSTMYTNSLVDLQRTIFSFMPPSTTRVIHN